MNRRGRDTRSSRLHGLSTPCETQTTGGGHHRPSPYEATHVARLRATRARVSSPGSASASSCSESASPESGTARGTASRCALELPRFREVTEANHVLTTLPLAGELEQPLSQDVVGRDSGERLRRVEGARTNHVHVREGSTRVPQRELRLGLDQVHLGEAEVREVVRVGVAVQRVRQRRELVEANALSLRSPARCS